MTVDIVLKVILLAITLPSVGKVVHDTMVSRKSQLHNDYRLAKEFLEDLRKIPPPHPLVVERGYHAIAGDRSLSVQEIEYLLSLENPSSSLRDYVLAREYLEYIPENGHFHISFKKKYAAKWSRQWRCCIYILGYFVCAALAISPLIFFGLFKDPATGLLLVLLSFIAFGFPAWSAIKGYVRLTQGERLVFEQQRKTGLILHQQSDKKAAGLGSSKRVVGQ